jgi:toxin-antitoxin system PIN domain toxin
VGLPLASALGFVRIMTNPRFGLNPMRVKQCMDHVRSWLAIPVVRILTPGEDHLEIVLRLIEQVGVAGNLTTDAHLAALAIEYRAELASTDLDFGRFKGLRWFDPS